MPSTGARGYRVSRGLAPSGVQGQSPWSGGLGDEVPQKQTIFNSVKCSFLMNNNITFSFITQSESVKLGKNTKLTNVKHKYGTLYLLTYVTLHLFIHSPLISKPTFSHPSSFAHSY